MTSYWAAQHEYTTALCKMVCVTAIALRIKSRLIRGNLCDLSPLCFQIPLAEGHFPC